MIYLDNAATTLQKPPSVATAVYNAIHTFGNAGRSFYEPTLLANRAISSARLELATLFQTPSASSIAFTSSATDSINLVVKAVLEDGAHVISTCFEHNSILRPLYNMDCKISWLSPNEHGVWNTDLLRTIIAQNKDITAFFCTHGSNVTGEVLPIEEWSEICRENNILFVLDASQTAGTYALDASMADIICFTGHKSLFGPQGTGGIVCIQDNIIKRIPKTGGSGDHSFEHLQSHHMPDCFEAGTFNAHGLAGLQKGVEFINQTGLNIIVQKEQLLINTFIQAVEHIPHITLFKSKSENQLPVCSLLIDQLSSAELSLCLWEEFGIATRSGIHCAPKLHEYLRTEKTGLTRFSFSYFTTIHDIEKAIDALQIISKRVSP